MYYIDILRNEYIVVYMCIYTYGEHILLVHIK